MADTFQLGVVLTLKDLLSNKLAGLNSHWDELKKKLGETDEAVKRVDAGFSKLASGATKLGAGIAIGFALKPAIDEARAFEKELSMTAAISKVSATELEGLKDAAIEAGMATKFSPTEAMAGLTALASAGIQGAENLKKSLIPALDLAAASAGKLSVDNAAADMAASMTSFTASGEKISDVFVNMANIASYRVEDLGAAWRGVNLAASSANQSLETTGAVMAALKNNGATVIESGEGVRMALTALKAPSIQAKQALDYLGVSAYDKNSGKFRDLIDIFEDLQKATNGMAEADRNAILQKILHEGGIKAFQATTKIGINETRQYAKTIGETGTAHAFALTQIDNFDGAVQILQGNIQTFKVLLGQGLMPALKMIFNGFSAILSPIIEFMKTHPRFTQFIGTIIGLTAVILTLAGAVQMAVGAWQIMSVWVSRNIVLQGVYNTIMIIATAAKAAWTAVMNIFTASIWAQNAAWYANPLTWIVAGIIALIAVTALAIYYWDTWTGYVVKAWQSLLEFKKEHQILFGVISVLLGPIWVFINSLVTIYQYWEKISGAITTAIKKTKQFFGIKETEQTTVKDGNIKSLNSFVEDGTKTAGGLEKVKNDINKKLDGIGKGGLSVSGLKDFKKQQKEIEKAKNAKPKKGTVDYENLSAFRKEENDIKKRLREIKRNETDLKSQYIGRKGELEKSMEWKGLQAQKEKLQEYQSLFQDLKDDQNYWSQKIQKTTNKTKIAEYTKELNKVQGKLNELQKKKAEFLKSGSVQLKAKTYSEYITQMSDKYKNNQMSGTQFALKSGLGMYGLLFDGLFGKGGDVKTKPNDQNKYWNNSINWLKTIAEYLKPKAKVEAQADAALSKKVGISNVPASSSVQVSPTQSATKSYTVEKGDVLWKIAKAHGVTTEELLAANPHIKNKNRIKPGETINIPVKISPAVPTPSPVNTPQPSNTGTGNGAKVDVKVSFMDKFMDFFSSKVTEEAGNY